MLLCLAPCIWAGGCGPDDDSQRGQRPGDHAAASTTVGTTPASGSREDWLGLLPERAFQPDPGHTPITTKIANREHQAKELAEIEVDASDRKQVRTYIGQVLAIGLKGGGDYSVEDPAVAALTLVGASNVSVLLEPLRIFGRFNGASYLVAALSRLAGEEHKSLIIGTLPHSPELLSVVVSHGWIQDARGVILSGLRSRDPNLSTEWIIVAARLGEEEIHDALIHLFIKSLNPRRIWETLVDLESMAPLGKAVEQGWSAVKRTPEERHVYRQWAFVAAHYGHVDALGILAADAIQKQRIAGSSSAFQQLTGFRGEDPVSWLAERRQSLRFNELTRMYE